MVENTYINKTEQRLVEPIGQPQGQTTITEKKKRFSLPNVFTILGGSILLKAIGIERIPLVVYGVFLVMLLIANTYWAEDVTREIARTSKELERQHVEYIQTRSVLMREIQQSVLEKRLVAKGIKSSVDPMRKLIIENDEQQP